MTLRNRDKVVLAALAITAIFVIGVAASSYLNTHDCCTTTSYSLASSRELSHATIATTGYVNVLELQLAINMSSSAPGISAGILVDAYNPTTSTANVTSASDWVVPLNYTNGEPCGDDTYAQNPTVGFAISQGYYTSSNITEAKLLNLMNPSATYSCPLYLGYANPAGFLFQPKNDTASSHGCNQSYCISGSASAGILGLTSWAPGTGYWSQGGSRRVPEGHLHGARRRPMGALVLAYFTVA